MAPKWAAAKGWTFPALVGGTDIFKRHVGDEFARRQKNSSEAFPGGVAGFRDYLRTHINFAQLFTSTNEP